MRHPENTVHIFSVVRPLLFVFDPLSFLPPSRFLMISFFLFVFLPYYFNGRLPRRSYLPFSVARHLMCASFYHPGGGCGLFFFALFKTQAFFCHCVNTRFLSNKPPIF